METTSYGNEWVENYLDALVRAGWKVGPDIVIHSPLACSPIA